MSRVSPSLLTYPESRVVANTIHTPWRLAASTVDLSMQGAVFRGLYNLGSPSVFNCTSSRCQWNDTYYSLGFTSSCADVTQASIRLHPNASETWNPNSKGRRQEDMVLTTPGGVELNAPFSFTSWQTVVSVNTTRIGTNSQNVGNGSSVSPELIRVGVFRTPVDNVNFTITPANMTIFECDLALSAYKYANLSSSGQNLTMGTREAIGLGTGIATLRDSNTGAGHITFTPAGLPPMTISGSDMAALQLLFSSTRFTGSIYEGLSGQPDQGTGDTFRSGDIGQTMAAMVDSMTNQLRSTYNVTAIGQSLNSVVFIEVDWPWITLPLVVQAIAIAFTVAVVVLSTRTAGLPLWKSSTMALLTYDVRFRDDDEDDVGRLGTGIRSTKELEALAKSWKAKLEVAEGK